jgi:hypothetical protein
MNSVLRFARAAGVSLALALTFGERVGAQEAAPPTGPAQIFQRSGENRAKNDVARAEKSGEAAAAQQNPEPVQKQGPSEPSAPVHEHPHAMLAPPSMPVAEAAVDLPVGTIDIDVTGPDGAPYPEAEIVLGVMASSSTRTEQRARGDQQGHHRFDGLATGSQQAYRVNVLYGGAKFSSTPFRLPDNAGYRVSVPLKATTHNDQLFLQLVGQTIVELRDDRLHITQQARLANAGKDVFVLPQDGVVITLPEGHTAFQWQDQMTDQKGETIEGKGFRLRGSFPPGTVSLSWTYDVPRHGSSARIPVNLPWKTYTYRLISEAPEGLSLRATDFPEAERVKDEGRWLLFTQIQRQPGDPHMGPFTLRLDGIPGPGPGRWIAALLASLLALFGLSRALHRADDTSERKLFIAKRKEQLIAEARAADAEHGRGESGPEYLARRMGEIETELALLLRDEEALSAKKPA